MNSKLYTIVPEGIHDQSHVEALALSAFGPGMYARTAFRLREHADPVSSLCFKAESASELIGSVRLTRVKIGNEPALLLGPLVVSPAHKCNGVGAGLMTTAVNQARAIGEQMIILVGDLPYYQKFGFEIVPEGQIALPGPVDPDRLLYCNLSGKGLEAYSGLVTS